MHWTPSIFILAGASAVVALVGFIIVHRLIRNLDLEPHKGFLDAMLAIVGTLVSILLGLLVASSLDHYRSLEQSVDTEAAGVAQVFRLTGGMPKEQRQALRQLALTYCTQVIDDEWPAMEHGGKSQKLSITYYQLVQTAVGWVPGNNGETNLHTALLSAVQQIGDCRRARLLALNSTWKQHLMPVLFVCSGIVLIFAFLYGREGAALHAVMICLVAVALGSNLGLILLLSNPFGSDWRLQPKPFLLNLQMLRELQAAPELQHFLETVH
jgi:Protein of unknown function (DUF4239)